MVALAGQDRVRIDSDRVRDVMSARESRMNTRLLELSASGFRAGESRTRFRPETSTQAKYSQDSQVGTFRARENMLATANQLITDHPLVRTALDTTVALSCIMDIHPQPATGDADLDALLVAAWDAYATNPDRCDTAGKHTFAELTASALWLRYAHGDVCAPIAESSAISLQEAYRMRSPNLYTVGQNTRAPQSAQYGYEGIVKDAQGRATGYWLTKSSGLPTDRVRVDDVEHYDATDSQGNSIFLHPCGIGRKSNRPLSSLAPISDLAYMQNDLLFVKVVQEQIATCVTSYDKMGVEGFGFLKELYAADPARVAEHFGLNGTRRDREWEAKPGRHDVLLPGVERVMNSPNLNPANFAALHEFMTVALGVNLDCPALSILLDAKGANFSSFRNVIWNTKLRFDVLKQWWVPQWHTPVYQHVLRGLVAVSLTGASDPLSVALRAYSASGRTLEQLYGCVWSWPEHPYIDPKTEIAASAMERAEGHITDAQWCNKHHAMSWDSFVGQMVQGRGFALEAALREKQRLLAIAEFSDPETQAEIRKIPLTVFMPIPLPKAYVPGSMDPDPAPPEAAEEAPVKSPPRALGVLA